MPSEQCRSISPGLVLVLCTDICRLAGKGHVLCEGPGDKTQGSGGQGRGVLAPGSRLHVLVGPEGGDEL